MLCKLLPQLNVPSARVYNSIKQGKRENIVGKGKSLPLPWSVAVMRDPPEKGFPLSSMSSELIVMQIAEFSIILF